MNWIRIRKFRFHSYISSKLLDKSFPKVRLIKLLVASGLVAQFSREKSIQIWMPTNRKAVFWNLIDFLRADMTRRRGFWTRHFFTLKIVRKSHKKAITQELLFQKLFPQIVREEENFQSVAVVSSSYIVQKRVKTRLACSLQHYLTHLERARLHVAVLVWAS